MVRDDDVREMTAGTFVEIESRWSDSFRSVVGLRGDAFSFDVHR